MLAMCLGASILIPIKEAAFLIAAGLLVLLRPLTWPDVKWAMWRLWPLLAMTVLALIATGVDVAGEYDSHAFARIAFYYARIPVFFLLGVGARRYLRDQRVLLWFIVILGCYTVSATLIRFAAASDLSGLNHWQRRNITGAGDVVSLVVPLCAVQLWTRSTPGYQKIGLLVAAAAAIAGTIVSDSRNGQLVIVLGLALSVLRIPPLKLATYLVPTLMVGLMILTTPILIPLLDLLSINASQISGLNEVIAAPRYDFAAINDQWRGYETYRAFLASQADGTASFVFGHGMSALADLGVYIELAADTYFNKTDEFHNGFSFIVLHSGLIGLVLYTLQLWLFTRPMGDGQVPRDEPQANTALYVLVVLSAVVTTPVVAGLFNQGGYASYSLFLLGVLTPFAPVRVGTGGRLAVPRLARRTPWR